MPDLTALLIDDQLQHCKTFEDTLNGNGFFTISARNATEAREIAISHKPDAIIVALHAPPLGAIDLCRQFQLEASLSKFPLMVCGSELGGKDAVAALEMGASDYVSNTVSPREIIARVRSMIRCLKESDQDLIRVGDIEIDTVAYDVKCGGNAVPLTLTEFNILKFLARAPGKVFTRSEIAYLAAAGESNSLDRTIDAHVKNIRRKLGIHATCLETFRGVGYRLR